MIEQLSAVGDGERGTTRTRSRNCRKSAMSVDRVSVRTSGRTSWMQANQAIDPKGESDRGYPGNALAEEERDAARMKMSAKSYEARSDGSELSWMKGQTAVCTTMG